jgi:lincosamide and streptogramin A transport system ATP-binding/permease protein
MATIQLNNVGFHYDSPFVDVLNRVTLSIDTAWRTALVGRNGMGKTTLLRLISGDLVPTAGNLQVPVGTYYFPFPVSHAEATTHDVIRDAVAPFRTWERDIALLSGRSDDAALRALGDLQERYEIEGGYDIDSRIEKEVVAIGMEPSILCRRFSRLSGGERTRALITALFLKHGCFALIDEPTDHLDMEGREVLGAYLAEKDGFVVVSHDRHFLDRCVDHVVAAEQTGFTITHGGFSVWKGEKDARIESEKRTSMRLKKEIRALKRSARQRRDWAGLKEQQKIGARDKGFIGHKAAKQMKRAVSIERRIEEKLAAKQELLRTYERERKLKLRLAGESPDIVLSLHDLSIRLGVHEIIAGFSATIRHGERVALFGPNGSGKTTLLRTVCGELKPSDGVIHHPTYITIARSYQDPLWESGFLRDHLRHQGVAQTRFRNVMAAFGVTGDIFDRPLETFSRGEQKKVDLCRSFLQDAHLWLWDEPLNFIDLMSREQIEEVVLEYQPTMLFVEHDRRFVEHVATDIIELPKRS